MKRALVAAFPYLIFLLLTLISWNRWIEPYVDSGRELMVPWRLAHGESLYSDVRFFHGPLAVYLAAAIDSLLGPSLAARIVFALAIALAHLAALACLARRLLSRGRACLAVAGIVSTAFFLRPGGQLFPFSFDTSLAVAAITWALVLTIGSETAGQDLAAGACLAVALLCRPEMGITAILVFAWVARPSRRLLPLVVAPTIAAAVVYALLSRGIPLQTLRREGWLAIIGPPEAFRNVYAAYAGFDRPALRLAELALAAIALALVATFLVAAAFFARAVAPARRLAILIEVASIALLGGAAAIVFSPPEGLAESFALLPPLIRVVPVLVVGACLCRVVRRVAGSHGPLSTPLVPDSVLFLSGLFAFRLFFAAGYVGPYNAFLLPLPLLVAAILIFAGADRAATAVGPALPRLVAGSFGVFLLFRFTSSVLLYRQPSWSRVETPAGAIFLTEPVATATREVLEDLGKRVVPGGSMVGFPEGGFLNYVLSLRNPLPQEQFFPGHLDERLEEQTIATLAARPPDAVLLCDVLAVGHGSRAFGQDYLARLDRFLHQNFEAVASYGPGAGPDARIGDPQFFITIRVPRRGDGRKR